MRVKTSDAHKIIRPEQKSDNSEKSRSNIENVPVGGRGEMVRVIELAETLLERQAETILISCDIRRLIESR